MHSQIIEHHRGKRIDPSISPLTNWSTKYLPGTTNIVHRSSCDDHAVRNKINVIYNLERFLRIMLPRWGPQRGILRRIRYSLDGQPYEFQTETLPATGSVGHLLRGVTTMVIDVLGRDDLPFPRSLLEFQRLFPDEAACAAYLERARWGDEFICDYCGSLGEPYRFANRPGVLRCRHCNRDTSLTADTVMERNTRHIGGSVPAATRIVVLRDCFSDSSQVARRHGLTRSGSDRR